MPSDYWRRTPLDSTTCWEMSGSGQPTGTGRITTKGLIALIQPASQTVKQRYYAEVLGRTLLVLFAFQFVDDELRSPGAWIPASDVSGNAGQKSQCVKPPLRTLKHVQLRPHRANLHVPLTNKNSISQSLVAPFPPSCGSRIAHGLFARSSRLRILRSADTSSCSHSSQQRGSRRPNHSTWSPF